MFVQSGEETPLRKDGLSGLFSRFLRRDGSGGEGLDPIRDEILGVERLEQEARSLAARHDVKRGFRRGYPLLARLDANTKALRAAYGVLTEAVQRDQAISPAAEWLIDNFFIVEEHVRVVRDALPGSYYRQLPKLASGDLQGHPRCYALAQLFVAHTDSRFDPYSLECATRGYQRESPLTMGELWALPIMLRMALIENLRRISEQIVGSRRARARANQLADQLLVAAGQGTDELTAVLRRHERQPLDSPFAVALVQQLRDGDPAVMPVLGWLEERLGEEGLTPDDVVRHEHLKQLSAHATTVNLITSMRRISAHDWNDFFERVSPVERILRRDPAQIYPQMDFATRDTYRHAIEELARGSKLNELTVAERVLEKANAANLRGSHSPIEDEDLNRYLGYHLIRGGRNGFEKELGFRAPISRWLRRAFLTFATLGYLGALAIVTGLLITLLAVYSAQFGVSAAVLVVLAALSLIPASDLAVAVLHRDISELMSPRRLPKLNFRSGIPEQHSSLIVVPTMLSSEADAHNQVEQIERHYLVGPRGHVALALLSDWVDAEEETLSDDDLMLAAAAAGISELNNRYGPRPDGGPRFLLLHRRRVWNVGENRWMGWERKRGKIHELNRFLRGARDTTFIERRDGLTDVPKTVKFVITLDSDTRLPPGAAQRMIGAMAHPLNRPRFDGATGRVEAGYGILQPRITPVLPSAGEVSWYHRIFSGPTGIDPYSAAVSDVYQDLFNEASYVGKGIYDVDAFETALRDRIPENSLLSHDLFEGSFARTGLVSDIELFDDYPTNYETSTRRAHRWARGDWQLLPWIVGQRPTVNGKRRNLSLPLINRWKMVDNLRRTLSAPSTFALLVAGWALLPLSPLLWTGFVVATIGMPQAVPVLSGLLPHRRGIAKRSHIRDVLSDAVMATARVGLAVVFVANRAAIMVDAIGRTLVRLVSRRHLLEWVTAARAGRGVATTLTEIYRSMWKPVALAVGAAIVLILIRPTALLLSLPVILLWVLSPAIALRLSGPREKERGATIGALELHTLRAVGRRTWRFFETVVGAEDNWLPPDNLQEDPEPLVAHRTSPTNVGMYLLSAVAARDFGWIGTLELEERLRQTTTTLETLERLKGHYYNWYDTRTLVPLEPRYISTVDSGNLAGALLTAAAACRDIVSEPAVRLVALKGVADTIEMVNVAVRGQGPVDRSQTVLWQDLELALGVLTEGLTAAAETSVDWSVRLATLDSAADELVDVAEALIAESVGSTPVELLEWARATRDSIKSHLKDLELLVPWGRMLADDVPETLVSRPEVAEKWEQIGRMLSATPVVTESQDLCRAARAAIAEIKIRLESGGGDVVADRWLSKLDRAVDAGCQRAAELTRNLQAFADRADQLADEMEFDFLYDEIRHLFPIGYRVSEGRHDSGYYDLLASEARLASLFAIAKRDVPVEHWFHLGRPVTPTGRGSALLSWSGSMFEYLMPYLVVDAAPGTLLDRTQRLVVDRQIRYGRTRGVPWGVSESAYNARDLNLNYQYSHFGIPGLGLTRGLSEDLVVAPYATALAVMIDPNAAARNFDRLAEYGALGSLGLYEALDFTPERVPQGQSVAAVKAYMAHHQGMTIVAIDNALNDGVMRRRFHSVPIISASELLLQERIPRDVSVARPRREEVRAARHIREIVPPVVRRFRTPHTTYPRTHLLSNGRYSVMITHAGSGYSHWNNLAVTRWREDPTRDSWGAFVYVRDVAIDDMWSVGYQPTAAEPKHYEVSFSEDRAEFHRRGGAMWTSMEVIVSPEDDGELRRVTVKNLGGGTKEIELTSYAEVVLTTPEADIAHPAFQKLFVQTEFLPAFGALLATCRPRSEDEREVWVAHVVAIEGETVGGLQYETDRARFVDRGHGVRSPGSVANGRPLSNTTGAVLDPILSLRRVVRLGPGETARATFSTLVAGSRESALALVDKYRETTTFERESELAWTQAQVQLQHLGIEADEAHLFQQLAGHIIYSSPALRPPSAVLARNRLGQSTLWSYGISGDLPIVLVRIDQMRDREIVRQLIRAHEYWGWKGLAVDLVVANEHPVSYAEELQEWLERSVRLSQSGGRHETHARHGEVHILRVDQMPEEDRDLLRAAARVVLLSHHGSLSEQLENVIEHEPEAVFGSTSKKAFLAPEFPPPRPRLAFFNGLGGFAEGGREYVTILGEGQWTPAPWINVISNPGFGFQVSESGSGYTWASNSRENRLTPWSNDPVTDPPGEVIYLRDEETGEIWTPTPLPIRQSSPYEIRHGQGWTRFGLQCHEIATELTQYVPVDDPIKISRLVVRNLSGQTRKLSVTAYVEWVLGVERDQNAASVVTSLDTETRALFAQNWWSGEFAGHVAFADLSGQQDEWTGDRGEFVGRHGTLREPAGMVPGSSLSARVGTGYDPCAALRRHLVLEPGASIEVVFLLGQGVDTDQARALVTEYRIADLDGVLDTVVKRWEDILGALQVRTPDYSMSIMLNQWLLYQALSCRIWARSAFYQSGGAYGFRDQLQDVMALVVAGREIPRAHLLRAAARQFPEGDVQHWWHPPSGRGVRTQISDDRVWLPLALVYYLNVTGDTSILDESIPFLEGAVLPDGEVEQYFEPAASEESANLYEHCARALDVSLGVGVHGLPLIGSGDWNDGMNRVGDQGRGESIWLAWFLHLALEGFIPIAEARGDRERVQRWNAYLDALKPAIAEHGWDGDWYRRAYFDDGTPLGSAVNEECRIDSIAQSWAVLSGIARGDRAERAMKAVEQHLVKRGDGLVLLFTPPFDKTPMDPGYIKGYLPGVRENGGQYTHAAIWSVLAFAELGDGDKAAELFSILNPINHASTRAGIHRYKVEPYVAVADVYTEPPHVGRGGWTWYTGSAGWMYRAGVEWILGFRLRGETLYLDPCIPRDWPNFELSFRYHSAQYEVVVENPNGVMHGVGEVRLDGRELELDHERIHSPTTQRSRPGAGARIELVDDGATHAVEVILG
jgi:cyclic beta-1,2-glucan synthetase